MPPAEIPGWLARFRAGHDRPATFLERGVALPFTTPCLLGGRIRPGERQGAELVLANPAGVKGVYVLPWSALPDLCPPSLHDRALWARVAALPCLTPRQVREAAREVAAAGYAGRAAARAASLAETERHQMRARLHEALVRQLLRQIEPPGSAAPPPEGASPAELERRALAALDRLHQAGGLPPVAAVEALAGLAGAFEDCGFGPDSGPARLPALAAGIAAMAREAEDWAEAAGSEAERSCARLVAQGAGLTLRCCRPAFAAAYALLGDLRGLLPRWQRAPEGILALLARPEWLLDGWDLIHAAWRGAEPAQRGAALREMAALVPLLPAESRDWVGFDAPAEMEGHRAGLGRWQQALRPNQDWMTGRLLDRTARNEMLRSLTA